LQEDERQRQEICRAIFDETEQLLRVIHQFKDNPTKLETPVFDKFEDKFWLLPSELSESIRKVYAMIKEANSLLGRTESAAVFRRNDLWYNYMQAGLTKLQQDLRSYESLLLSPNEKPVEEAKKAELVLLLRKMFDGATLLAIGRELHEPYCLQFNEAGYDKSYKYYEEELVAKAIANILSNDQILAISAKYNDKMRSFWDFSGKYYTYCAKTKELSFESAWTSIEGSIKDLLAEHGRATYAVLKAYLELRKDYPPWSACDYNQLAYRAKELSGTGWKQALIGLEVAGVIGKRGSGRRPGERSIALELIPLVEDVLSKWEETPQASTPTETATAYAPEVEKMSEPIWDVFICHASEDKKEVAEPLARMLTAEKLRVWYDKFTLTIGDSLRRKIDDGLANSRYGAVILSPSFFVKNWPQKELDGLAAREDSEGHKVILPIWHKVDQDYVVKYSPTLADRLASKTSHGLEVVLKELLEVVKQSPSAARQPMQGVPKRPTGETEVPPAVDLDSDMRQMILRYANDLTASHIKVLEFLDSPNEYGVRHGVKFGNYVLGGVSTILEEAIPEFKGRRDFYDQVVRDLHARGLLDIDESGIHVTMSNTGMFESRTTEMGKKLLGVVRQREQTSLS
jgi:hypothetical protein